jgi:hypothetical protein
VRVEETEKLALALILVAACAGRQVPVAGSGSLPPEASKPTRRELEAILALLK